MGKPNLQTVIVSKDIAATRTRATKVAREYANRIYTSRETETSWRFRQRPPTDFVKESFRTFSIPGEKGISLVYGKLKRGKVKTKRKKNASTLTETRRWKRYVERAAEAKNLEDLGKLAASGREWMPDERLLYVFESAVAGRARDFGVQCDMGRVDRVKRCVDGLIEGQQTSMFDNPRKRTVLKRPRVMPDPGPCAWLGGLLEWAWDGKGGEYLWEPPNGGEWIFLWSPELKAVVGVPMPRSKKRLTKVSRKAGGAKMFERFSARDAENTYEIDLPGVNLKKLGPAQHIVYRSDKWNPGEDTDYIHEFGKGVEIYVGPSLARPKVFLCFGGKLTATERGLVY